MSKKLSMRIIYSLYVLFFFFSEAHSQEKEVLLIGSMHTVPKLVKHSYKPLLRRALQYNPEAIYVEAPRGDDTLSWEYLKDGWSDNYKQFYFLSDSLIKNFQYNEIKLNQLLEKRLEEITASELDIIINSFGYLRDNPNYELYSYIKKYGIKGSKKPTRHEDGDLTAKLAIKLQLKRLKSMDFQQTNKEYHEAWDQCGAEGRNNGNNDINNKLNKKQYNSAILPALFRGLGMHVNTQKSLERLHQLSSFTYVKNKTEGCSLGEKYWRIRNENMVKNIAEQVLKGTEKRNLVIVGASHIIGLKEEFEKSYPEIKLIFLNM
ncbi:DUF5694 domain-containing protein [Flammeovirga sp. SJP92]|uniref:DUF5694 domain-containing protein n=1 Tax=Flammeovirga sp. SJP92 TaxID=1775430 RepID=UPI000787B7FD|nr:DUF5694 domain-containing protein [Flammeovirga sp. SJP92]KXX71135.1 hypothetical protein AVL50_09900 [Flammeovirga sp. SJP92]